MMGSLIVFAVGNPSRGDDALGPLLLRRIESQFPALVTVEDFQLQIEHALDLQGRDLALFVDAAVGLGRPFRFGPVGPARHPVHSSHSLEPAEVLAVHTRALGTPPPPAYVLALGGAAFELGHSPSPTALKHLEAAWAFLQPLLATPDLDQWAREARNFALRLGA